MKRSVQICFVVCLLLAASASAQMQDFTGQTWATGHLGYAFGMGDAFQDYSDPYTGAELSSDAGIGFGGQFYYGVKPNMLIGGELMFQQYKVSLHMPANLSLGIPEIDESDSQTELNILANTMFAVSQSRTSALFLMGGTGLYDFGGTELGLNTGLFWRKQVSDNVHLFGMPRLHVVFADTTPMMIQFTMGAQFSLGG
jgi:hypothetical protein